MKLLKCKKRLGYKYEPPVENKLDIIEEAARHLGLSYNFGCVKYILDKENISFGQLRCAQFFNGHDYYYDVNRAAYYLVLAGLVGSGQDTGEDHEALEKHTYKILDDWASNIGDIALLYLQLIKQLEERHFFITGATLEIMEQISSMNSYKSYNELIKSMIAQTMIERHKETSILTSLAMRIQHYTTV